MAYYAIEPPNPWGNIKGKPYITVSARGIANGLSDIPNDGADFGPDTPGTQTNGIQEAVTYALANLQKGPTSNTAPIVKLTDGEFFVKKGIVIDYSNSSFPNGFGIYGADQMATYINVQTNDDLFFVNNPTSYNLQLTLANMQPTVPPGYNPNSLLNWRDPRITNQTLIIQHLNGSNGGWVNGTLYLQNLSNIVMFDHERYDTGVNISNAEFVTDIGGTNMLKEYAKTNNGAVVVSNIYNVAELTIIGASIGWYELNNINAVKIIGNEFQGIVLTGNIGSLFMRVSGDYISTFANTSNFTTPTFLLNKSGTTVNIGELDAEISYWFRQSGYQWSNGNISYGQIKNLHLVAVNSSLPNLNLPTDSSTAGTTAGTVNMHIVEYLSSYKKLVITFSGYENSTTTNQTINFPLPFSSYAVITANNTGLTISASTTGIAITSPNNTTTYSGIVIVEGY